MLINSLMHGKITTGEKNKTFFCSQTRGGLCGWEWGREENGSKVASDCILQITAVFSSWDLVWEQCASRLLAFSSVIPKIPAASVEALL